jgi:hypothetical protein
MSFKFATAAETYEYVPGTYRRLQHDVDDGSITMEGRRREGQTAKPEQRAAIDRHFLNSKAGKRLWLPKTSV